MQLPRSDDNRDLPSGTESREENRELAALLEGVRQGSDRAAWEIIERYGSHVLRVVRRNMHYRLRTQFDSLDFVQMVWASFFRSPEDLRHLQTPRQLLAWLAVIARNKVIDEIRSKIKAQRRTMSLVTSIGEVEDRTAAIAGREPTPSAVAIARERWDSLMQEQPPQVRTILNKRLAGAKYSDIADELGLHERTVRKAVKKVFSRCRS